MPPNAVTKRPEIDTDTATALANSLVVSAGNFGRHRRLCRVKRIDPAGKADAPLFAIAAAMRTPDPLRPSRELCKETPTRKSGIHAKSV
jgi:hypothetical protein